MNLATILEESTTYQWLVSKGEAKGRQETLLELGSERFGPPTEQVAASLRAVTDPERLKRMARRVLVVTS